MNQIKRLQPEQREDLVAYLDGELEGEKTRAIDKALADSPVARHEVEMLTRTWEMLDLLPREKASEEFTQTTLHTIKAESQLQPAVKVDRYYPQIRFALMSLIWLIAVSATSWAGFHLANRWIANPYDELIEDLPVIQNLELYESLEIEDGDGIDFLKELERTRVVDE